MGQRLLCNFNTTQHACQFFLSLNITQNTNISVSRRITADLTDLEMVVCLRCNLRLMGHTHNLRFSSELSHKSSNPLCSTTTHSDIDLIEDQAWGV